MNSARARNFAPESRPEDAIKWNMADGDPELHMYMERIAKIGGRVLDLGAGLLRNSRLFAERDMSVVAVDNNATSLTKGLSQLREPQVAGHINLVEEDIQSFLHRQIGGTYDVVLMSEFPNHAGSRQAAIETAKMGYESVSAGGYFWLRTVSTLDDSFAQLQAEYERHPDSPVKRGCEDDHTFYTICNCSGEREMEPQTFFEPYDIHDALELDDAQVVYERVRPTIGYPNIIGGKHLTKPQYECKTFGYVSLLAQRPE